MIGGAAPVLCTEESLLGRLGRPLPSLWRTGAAHPGLSPPPFPSSSAFPPPVLAMSNENYSRSDLTKACGICYRQSQRGASQLLWL